MIDDRVPCIGRRGEWACLPPKWSKIVEIRHTSLPLSGACWRRPPTDTSCEEEPTPFDRIGDVRIEADKCEHGPTTGSSAHARRNNSLLVLLEAGPVGTSLPP